MRHQALSAAKFGLIFTLFAGAFPALSDDQAVEPLYGAPYLSILGAYDLGDRGAGNGGGGAIGAGLRRGEIGFEARASYLAQKRGTFRGGTFNGLFFPSQRLPGLYATFGIGLENISGYAGAGGNTFNATTIDGGAGYLFPLKIGRYQFGLRSEALYQYEKREKRQQDQAQPTEDLPVPTNFHEVVLHIGFQFPLGWSTAPAVTEKETPVKVVPVEQGQDLDLGDLPHEKATSAPQGPAPDAAGPR
jgi:hypothetical protein